MILLIKLNSQQEKAARKLDGASLVIAVPGSGKTTILLKRMNNLINSGVDPKKILTISFSRAAANELKERFKRSYDPDILPNFQTIHAFSFMILRDYGKKKSIDYKLLESSQDTSKYRLILDLYKKYNRGYLSEERMDELLCDIGYAKNMMLEPEDVDSMIPNFVEIFEDYETYKKKFNYIDFDDMLTLAYEVLTKDKAIRDAYISAYDYVQVDEGQDTSKIQMEIIKLITKDKNNLFIVADDDQSIYSFRGANPDGLFLLEDFYKDLEIINMDMNFRSSKNIVQASSAFIKKNQKRFEKNLKTSNDYISPVDIIKVNRPIDQYLHIMDSIKDDRLEDIGILYRNNVSAMGLIEFLERLGVDFNIGDSSSVSFYSNRIVRDVISILKFESARDDLDLFTEIFYKLDAYISRSQVNYLHRQKYHSDILSSIKDIPGNPDYTDDSINRLIKRYDRLSGLHFHDKISFIAYEMGYRDYIKRSSKKMGQGVWSQLLVLDSLIQVSSNVGGLAELETRLRYLDLLIQKGKKSKTGINLSTVHSAKGREYKKVFIIDAYEGVFPSKIDEGADSLEEERRLFYVAMTRAKEDLSILFPSFVANEELIQSSFIDELTSL